MQLAIIIFGAVFAALGVYLNSRQKKLMARCTARTEGRVAEFERREHTTEREDPDMPNMIQRSTTVSFAPVFAYTVNGVEMKKATAASSARPKLKEGQSVTVFYDPADPGNFYVPEDADSRSTGRLFIIIGAAAAVLGVVLFLI